jgi:DNA-binding NarL/FixJ family response regulator
MPTVILVEDFLPLQLHFATALKRVPGVQVIGVSSTEDHAVELIARHAPDVVVLDLSLASGSGQGVVSRCTGLAIEPKFIVLTNLALDHYREWFKTQGVDLFLEKTNFDQLIGLLRDWPEP